MKKGVIFGRELALGIVCIVLFFGFASAQESGLDSNSLLLKVTLHQGENLQKNVVVSDPLGGEFNLEVVGLRGVSLNVSSLILTADERKSLSVKFDSSGLKPGVYAGKITVTGERSSSFVPIIFEVESREVLFDAVLDIPPAYTEIETGSKLVAQVKIYDLDSGGGTSEGNGVVNVDMEYQIMGFDGQVISSETDNIILQKQAQLTKPVSFPEDVAPGDYVMVVIAKGKESVGVSSQMFSIIGNANSQIFNFSGSGFFVVTGGIVIFIFGIVLFFIYMIHDRDKMFLELKRINAEELEKQRDFLVRQQEIVVSKRARHVGKTRAKKEVRKEVNEKINNLKEKQKERVREYKGLKRNGDLGEMSKKLREWKSKGYNTLPLEYKLKDLTADEMSEIMGKWKKKYS